MIKSLAAIDTKHNNELIIDEIQINDPKSDEVIINIKSAGICGSQLLSLTHPKIQRPQLLGHEATGIVYKKGNQVNHLNEGDRVIISWLPFDPNEKTEYLKWCNVKWGGKQIKSILFTWSQYSLMHHQFVSKIPSDVDIDCASIIGCAVATGAGSVNNIGSLGPNHSVAVFGAGGLGLFTINAAKNIGVKSIIAIDINNEKLNLASELGAHHTINSKNIDPVSEILSITDGGVDYVYDMVGVPEVLEQSIECSKKGILGYSEGGKIILGGFPHSSREFNPRSLINGQRTYIGSKGGFTNPKIDFPKYYDEYRLNKLPLEKIITANYKLEDVNIAVDDFANNRILGRGIINIG